MSKNFRLSGSVKKISFLLTVLIVSLALGNFVFAVWSEPTSAPPDDNVAAPINVSSAPQIKSGDLSVTALYDTNDSNYYINPSSTLTPSGVFAGNVGIGTTAPNAKLTVVTNNNEDSLWYSYNDTNQHDFDLIINRARGTSTAPLAVNSLNNLGSIRFHGYDGVGFIQGAIMEAFVDGTPGINDMPTRLQFGTTPDGASTFITRMVIKNDGNVGIGTTDPNAPLHVFSSTGVGPEIRVQSTEPTRSADLHVQADGREWAFGVAGTNTGSRANKFFINDTTAGGVDRLTIDTAGNVGIGTTDPRAVLHVVGDEVVIDSGAADGSPEINFVDSSGTGDVSWRIGSGTGNYLAIDSGLSADWNTSASPNWDMIFRYVNASNSANVGIGTGGNPGAKLDVNGNVKIGNDPVQANKALCWMANKTIGYCSTQPDATGSCACNAIN